MITESKVIELFCMADEFCKFFDAMMTKYTFKPTTKRKYHRDSTMSKAEIMLILILFHDSGYRCLKHFYLEKVCKHMRHLFPKVFSYNRFVELEKEVAIPLALFIKKALLGKCTGISFVDSTPLRVCKNQRIHIHKTFCIPMLPVLFRHNKTPKVFCLTFGVHVKLESRISHLHKIFYSARLHAFLISLLSISSCH